MEKPRRISDGPAADADTRASVFTEEVAASGGDLAGLHLLLAELLGPIGNECRMGGSGNRIFGNARLRGEEAADEVDPLARRGGNDAEAIELAKRGHVGLQIGDFLLGGEDSQIIAGFGHMDRRAAESFDESGRNRTGSRGPRREIERVEIAVAGDGQLAGARVEADRATLIAEMFKDHMRRRKRRVTTQIDLHRRRTPSQVVSISALYDERRFRQIVFRSDRL